MAATARTQVRPSGPQTTMNTARFPRAGCGRPRHHRTLAIAPDLQPVDASEIDLWDVSRSGRPTQYGRGPGNLFRVSSPQTDLYRSLAIVPFRGLVRNCILPTKRRILATDIERAVRVAFSNVGSDEKQRPVTYPTPRVYKVIYSTSLEKRYGVRRRARDSNMLNRQSRNVTLARYAASN